MTGASDADTPAWLMDREFPLGGGINGLAAELGEPVWTHDYTADPRIPHDGNDDEVLRSRLREAGPRRAADFSWQRSAEILWRAYGQLQETGTRQA